MKGLFPCDQLNGMMEFPERHLCEGGGQVAKSQLDMIARSAVDNITFLLIVIQCLVPAHKINKCAANVEDVNKGMLPKKELYLRKEEIDVQRQNGTVLRFWNDSIGWSFLR